MCQRLNFLPKSMFMTFFKKCMTSNIATRLQSTTLTRMPYRSGSSACWGCSGCSCGGCFFWCILLLGCLHVRWFYTPTSPSPSAPYTLVVVSHVCFVVCVCMCVLSLRASICIPSHCLPLYSAVLLWDGEIGITKLAFNMSTIFFGSKNLWLRTCVLNV